MTMKKRHVRTSVMCIPIIDNKVVIVRDRVHHEWTFPGGGKKHNETLFEACVRELREETRNTIHVPPHDLRFLFLHRHSTDEFVECTYVFAAFVSNAIPFSAVHAQFACSAVRRACHNETDGMRLISFSALQRYNTWCKIRPIAKRLVSHPTMICVM